MMTWSCIVTQNTFTVRATRAWSGSHLLTFWSCWTLFANRKLVVMSWPAWMSSSNRSRQWEECSLLKQSHLVTAPPALHYAAFRVPGALSIPSGWRHLRKPPCGQMFNITGSNARLSGFFFQSEISLLVRKLLSSAFTFHRAVQRFCSVWHPTVQPHIQPGTSCNCCWLKEGNEQWQFLGGCFHR